MAGFSLTVSATMKCPHGGTVIAIPTGLRPLAGGSPCVTIADTFIIAGCPFVLPGPTPSPCIRVQWIVFDMMSRVEGSPTLSQSSVGLCLSPAGLPQGTVIVVSTQTKVQSR